MLQLIYELRKNCRGTGRVDGWTLKVLQEVLADLKNDSPEKMTKGSLLVEDNENSDSMNLVGIGHRVGLHGLFFLLFLFYRTQVRS